MTKSSRQPVHVVYGGAHLYRADAPSRLARTALAAMSTWGNDDGTFAKVVGLRDANATTIHELARRVREKLQRDPVEKVCIDFEDGFGLRRDAEEDAEATRAAGELARASGASTTTVGIRIKALGGLTAARGARTLELFLSTLRTTVVSKSGEGLPLGFTVTLPKVSRPADVTALADLLSLHEQRLGIKEGSIGIELMVETPRALLDTEGRVALPSLVAAARGRCVAAHLGAYDLTAGLGVTASAQRLDHPACDLARLLMQVSLAGTDVVIVDGATTVLPTTRHRATAPAKLDEEQLAENATDVHRAWSLHAAAVTRALDLGIYQGWDFHPAQLPARYGAVYAFFLTERSAMAARLHAFVVKATQAMRTGQIFDDAATGQGLLNFFVRGVACGALTEDDLQATGLSLDELRAGEFAQIVATRTSG